MLWLTFISGGLLIVVQDQSMYEEAENSVIQPNHDNSSESLPQAGKKFILVCIQQRLWDH